MIDPITTAVSAVTLKRTFKLYAWFYFGGFALMMAGVAAAVVIVLVTKQASGGANQVGMVAAGLLIIAAAGVLVTGIIFSLMVLYRVWAVMQGRGARTTPGKAVGFLFIPFFNFYWIFVAYHGLAKDINAHLDEAGLTEVPRVTASLALLSCIFTLAGWIPYLGGLIGLGNLVISFLILKQFTDSAVGIVQTAARPAQSTDR